MTKNLVINKPITLDLGANNIEAGAQAVLILGDTTVTGTGTINSSHQQSAVQVENAKLTLAGGNVNSTTLYGINLVGNSELAINGGNVHSKDSCISPFSEITTTSPPSRGSMLLASAIGDKTINKASKNTNILQK